MPSSCIKIPSENSGSIDTHLIPVLSLFKKKLFAPGEPDESYIFLPILILPSKSATNLPLTALFIPKLPGFVVPTPKVPNPVTTTDSSPEFI